MSISICLNISKLTGEKLSFSVLVTDGCSPVGCVLTQLLKRWGAFVTATCNIRSVPVIQALGKYILKLKTKSIDIILFATQSILNIVRFPFPRIP